MAHDPTLILFAVNKHKVAGVIVIVAGAILAVFGGFRAMRRASGAALVGLAGIAVVVIGILVFTRTIRG